MRKARIKKLQVKNPDAQDDVCRLDKWLWAARFFKTRQLAKDAVETGKVRYNGDRTKSSRLVKIGAILNVKQSHSIKTIVVKGLSSNRKSASQASLLYTETEESVELRTEAEAIRKAKWAAEPDYGRRPDKSTRRKIHRFKNVHDKE